MDERDMKKAGQKEKGKEWEIDRIFFLDFYFS
jgi:hypothetical protein